MRGFKILPFLVLLFLCLAFTYSQQSGHFTDIPIPDTAPPSSPPSDIGSDYGNDGCPDWRLHHQCHLRQGYPGQYGGSYLFVDLFCANVPPCAWSPYDFRDFYALGVGNQPNLAAPHTPLPSYSWIAKCPFGGGKNRGWKRVTLTSVNIVWRSSDDDNDDDRDGRRDAMWYIYSNGRLTIYHTESKGGKTVHTCVVYSGDPFPTPHQVPGPPRHSWDYAY
jgi:hypothetical protein